MGCGGALLVLAWAITASANQIRDSLDNNAKQQLLTAHNTARAARGACPLEWSNTLEDSIVKTPEMINCGSSLPDDIPPGTTWSSVYVQKEGDVIGEYIRMINEEETSFTGTATRQTRNYVQAVWKASKTMGCRTCLESLDWGGYQAFTMCKFDPPGNVAGTEQDNIGKVGETCDMCQGKTCPPPSQCHNDGQCDPMTGKCSESKPLPDGTDCDDNDALTTGDKCQGGQCVGTHKCDSITCVAQACQLFAWCDRTTGSCDHMKYPEGATCQDGNPATVFDKCVNGTCVGLDLCKGVTCPGETDCMKAARCDRLTGACVADPKPGGACDDGDVTTTGDTCTAQGDCVGTSRCVGVVCLSPPPCKTGGTCNGATGDCVYINAPEGTSCDDGLADTTEDRCVAGVCQGKRVSTEPEVVLPNGAVAGVDAADAAPWLRRVPKAMEGGKVHRLPRIEPGTGVKLSCPAGGPDCEFFLVAPLRCPGCPAGETTPNGGYPAALPAAGWEARSCSPEHVDGQRWIRTVAFRREVAAGQDDELPDVDRTLSHAAIVSKYNTIACTHSDRTACEASTGCLWADTMCLRNWCPRSRSPSAPRAPPAPHAAQCVCAL